MAHFARFIVTLEWANATTQNHSLTMASVFCDVHYIVKLKISRQKMKKGTLEGSAHGSR